MVRQSRNYQKKRFEHEEQHAVLVESGGSRRFLCIHVSIQRMLTLDCPKCLFSFTFLHSRMHTTTYFTLILQQTRQSM